MTWNILYRGSLTSCNYECSYCPFAKMTNTRSELAKDQSQLERFVEWVGRQKTRLGILITPWGEALVHSYYRRALIELSHLPNIYHVAIQTNLSGHIEELAAANHQTFALWTTFHPTQVSLERFLKRCHQLDSAGIRYSVGVVGLREHFDAITQLREMLRPEIYLWINAFKRDPGYYHAEDIQRLEQADPYFRLNLPVYQSANKPCAAGNTAFTVDGAGNVRRCHFIKDVIGNIYADDFASCLRPRNCSLPTCRCYIGYIHQPELALQHLYGDTLLARIPKAWPLTHRDHRT